MVLEFVSEERLPTLLPTFCKSLNERNMMENILTQSKAELEDAFVSSFGIRDGRALTRVENAFQIKPGSHYWEEVFLSDDRAEHVDFDKEAFFDYECMVRKFAMSLSNWKEVFYVRLPVFGEEVGARQLVLDTPIPLRLTLKYDGAKVMGYRRAEDYRATFGPDRVDDDGFLLDLEGDRVPICKSGHTFLVDMIAGAPADGLPLDEHPDADFLY